MPDRARWVKPFSLVAAIVLLALGAPRFIANGFMPAVQSLGGDFAATFPAPYFARLRPDFDASHVWRGGWYYGPMLHALTLPLLLVPRWSLVPPVWAAMNLVAVMVSFGLACWLSGVARQVPRAALAALGGLWLLYQPLVNCFAQGNIEIIEMATTLAAIALLTKGKGNMAGALMGIAAMIKFLPVGFVGWFLIRRRYRELAASLVTIVVIAAVTAVTLGWANSVTLQDMLWAESSPIAGFHESSVTSLFLHRTSVLDPGRATLYWIPSERSTVAARAGLVASVLLAGGCALAMYRRRRKEISPFELSVLFMAMFMIVPWNHDYYYIFALVPLSVLFLQGLARGDAAVLGLTFLAYELISPTVPFGLLDRLGWFRLPAAQALNYLDVPVYGALLLWFLAAREMYAEPVPARIGAGGIGVTIPLVSAGVRQR